MKQLKFSVVSLLLLATIFFSSCKKDDAVIQPGAVALTQGRAGISFNSSVTFGNSTTFNVRNTSSTLATTQPFGSTSRAIVLEASESYGSINNTRTVHIDILVKMVDNTTNGPITIDLSLNNGNPQAHLAFTYGDTFSGYTVRSTTGTLTITKLTATEIEGNFNATAGSGGPSFTNGTFAGKF